MTLMEEGDKDKAVVKQCPNCRQFVEHNYDFHVIFCERNMTLCLKCNEVIQKKVCYFLICYFS
jgi:hypothetical protein